MKTIGQAKMMSFLSTRADLVETSNGTVRSDPGHAVHNFLDLSRKIAAIQFYNSEHVLMFRGQSRDHKNFRNNTSVKPSLFRPVVPDRHPPGRDMLERRFNDLQQADQYFLASVDRMFHEREALTLKRYRILRWAILQHYGICMTPLLDLTQSLRVAASFASAGGGNDVFVYVLGVPNVSGSVTASAEAGLQVIRLSSVCPPDAVRPHIQEGYLLGEYPDMPDFNQKQHYEAYEIDFGRRLIAKFRFNPRTFWEDDYFPVIPEPALYPATDPLLDHVARLKADLGQQD